MSKRLKWRLKLFVAFVALTSLGGPLYATLFGLPGFIEAVYHTMVNGLIGGSMLWSLELLLIPSRYGAPLRRLPFVPATILRSLVAVVIVTMTGPLSALILYGHFDPLISFQAGPSLYLYVVGTAFVLYGVVQIVRVVGPRVLLNIFVGRYRRPVQEQRIFLFLDLEGSTALSEQMGDLGVRELINQFFFDITEPILEWDGEIHRYVGDEVVVTWPLKKGLEDARCLRCCLAIRQAISARAERYRTQFGVVPEFRIGLHGGEIVASLCGDTKQEMVYFGDTINTAARIEQYCKEVGRKLLISEDLAAGLANRSIWHFEDVGAVRLRGRAEEMSLLALQGQP